MTSTPINRLGSHLFIAPFYILVFALNICLAATIYKYPRSRHLGRFGCEDYRSPNTSSGESFIQCTILHTCIRAQELWSVNMIFCNFDYLQVSALKTSQAFGCEEYLSPSMPRGESLTQCAMLHTCNYDEPSRSFNREDYLSPSRRAAVESLQDLHVYTLVLRLDVPPGQKKLGRSKFARIH